MEGGRIKRFKNTENIRAIEAGSSKSEVGGRKSEVLSLRVSTEGQRRLMYREDDFGCNTSSVNGILQRTNNVVLCDNMKLPVTQIDDHRIVVLMDQFGNLFNGGATFNDRKSLMHHFFNR